MKNKTTTLAFTAALAFITAILPQMAQAQFRSAIDVQEWPSGKIVLATGDTIYGPVTFHRSQEVINVQNEDGSLSSFSPVNVQYFVAQEQPSGRAYTFRSLMWDMGRDYSDFKKPTFFEQLNQGPLTLIMRESYVHKDSRGTSPYSSQGYLYDSNYYAPGSEWLSQIKELYYVMLPDGEIVTLRNVRKDLHKLFGKRAKQMKKYVKEHKLSYEKPHHVVAIVNYFNAQLQVSDLKQVVAQEAK
ncbi:hypothetical protein [Pontibacter actiniarum]|uniref:DUF4476 domain-containing protein n=1 Tax=Pontibacter actiniarum TaxID=323450 RepID=A0A1X9YTD2_9BACT|nr:hypothetical protein [Pontibacter actiniarum]ARS36139.1 hypothetical protein CA264_12250 [Pontibacter actiniarum]